MLAFSHKVVAFWGEGRQMNSPVEQDPNSGVAFRGRSYRLNGTSSQGPAGVAEAEAADSNSGVSFRGRSYRLGDS